MTRDAVTTALAVGVASYAGSLVGLSLRWPPATPSVVWPPNAILTGFLIAKSPYRWPPILLGGLAGHLAAEVPTGWPLSLVLAFFVTNCFEALIAAIGVRWLSDEPGRLDTLRRLATFVGAAVIAAPLLSTFADAGVAAWLHGDSYWRVWRTRLPSNILSQLVITPAVVAIVLRGRAWLRDSPLWRYGEAVALGVSLFVVGWAASRARFGSTAIFAVASDTPLAVLLPFVLWAALRFGPAGTSVALMIMSCVTSRAVVHSVGPYRSLPPDQLMVALQMFLITGGLTLLGLATLIEERRQAMHALGRRLQFEKLLSEFSRAFVQVPSGQLDRVCHEWLGRLGGFLNLDCVRLFEVVRHDAGIAVFAQWRRPGFGSAEPLDLAREFPWVLSRIVARTPVALPRLDAFSPDAARDRESLQARGYKAIVVVPLLAGERLVGALAVGTAAERTWPDELVANLRLLAEVLANAVARQQADDALRRAEVEAQQSRQRLAHVARVSTVGELTASLAHQLNQPLTGIMCNAQAACRFLEQVPPDYSELRETLSDIVDDARRAGEVILRLRRFLQKGESEITLVDVNAVIRGIVCLVNSDAVIRNVAVTLELDAERAIVRADRVQLEQVLLNLLVNAMEAIGEDSIERAVRVSCRVAGRDEVQVMVRDSGVGLVEGAEELVFDPFYTTKPNGMGMGLSIARSIVETHGGSILARNDRAQGTVIELRLPRAAAPELAR